MDAYIEYNGQLRSRYGKLARKLGDEEWRETAARFAAAQTATEIAIRNGLGVPVLLTEVQLSPNPLHDLRFSGLSAPSLDGRRRAPLASGRLYLASRQTAWSSMSLGKLPVRGRTTGPPHRRR